MAKKKKDTWNATKMMEFAEEQKVTNVLLNNLHTEMTRGFQELRAELKTDINACKADLQADVHALRVDVQDLRVRFDVHRAEAFRRITDLEQRGKKNGK